jgi:hypothetical protein
MTLHEVSSHRGWTPRNPGRLRAEPRPGAKFGSWERYSPLLDGMLAGGRMPRLPAHSIAYGLGAFSIALGLLEALAPDDFARFLGMRPRRTLIWGYGLREMAAGIGILASPRHRRAPLIWSRVAGDGLDLVSLGRAMARPGNRRGRVALAFLAVVGIAALDIATARALSKRH